MVDSNSNEEVLPYDSTPFAGWSEKVASWGWTVIYQDQLIAYYGTEGNCPRCGDHMSCVISNAPRENLLVEAERFIESLWTDTPPETVLISCNCQVAHPPHAAGEGCGQSAYIPFKKAIQKP
jgi:hypothetical protein